MSHSMAMVMLIVETVSYLTRKNFVYVNQPVLHAHILLGKRNTTVKYTDTASSAKPDQTPQNAPSDQVLHCLVTEVSF